MSTGKPLPTRLSAEDSAFVCGPVSITLAARNAAHRCSVARAYGCRVDMEGTRISLFVRRSQAPALLADIAANGLIAAVFCLPSTNRTLQLKGRDARIESLAPEEVPLAHAHTEAFVAEVLPLEECSEDFLRAAMHVEIADCLAIRFTLHDGFTQTPGPGAGARL